MPPPVVTTTANDGQTQEQQQSQVQISTQSSSTTISNQISAGSTSTASNAGNSQSVEFSSPDDIKIRNVVSPGTPNSYPTSPCRVAISAGFSIAGGALSGGGSIEDKECTLRETARSFGELGIPEMGLYLLCQQSDVVNGWKDHKNRDEKGARDTIGSTECFRLVREFQRGDLDGDAKHYAKELEVLRREQQMLEEELSLYRQECSGSADRAFRACQQDK